MMDLRGCEVTSTSSVCFEEMKLDAADRLNGQTCGKFAPPFTRVKTVTDRVAHVFTISGCNLGDAFYRNHLSFIKDIAPEIGRYVRLNYSLRLSFLAIPAKTISW